MRYLILCSNQAENYYEICENMEEAEEYITEHYADFERVFLVRELDIKETKIRKYKIYDMGRG